MKKRERNAIIKSLELPDFFTIDGDMGYILIRQHEFVIFVGLSANPTMHKELCFVHYFIQPLYIPSDGYTITIGYRIGGYWKATDTLKIKKEISKIKFPATLIDVNNLLQKEFGKYIHPLKFEFLGLNFLIQKNYTLAINELKKAVGEMSNISCEMWAKDIGRVQLIIELLESQKYDEAERILLVWQAHTANNLKLLI